MPRKISFRPASGGGFGDNKKPIYFIGGAVVIAIVLSGYYLLSNPSIQTDEGQKQTEINAIPQLDEKQVQEIVTQIEKVTPVKKDEKPVITEIVDVENLKKTNAFYKDAQNGDKLIVFAQDKKVIIYRPSTNQVINIAALSDSK